jgi:hypothetical protein
MDNFKKYLPSRKFITIVLFIIVLIVLFFSIRGLISLIKNRKAKFELLQAESKNTFVKYGLYVAVAIFAFGTLWFLTRDKSQTNG